MRNILFIILSVLVMPFSVSAQITLTSGSYPPVITGTDSLKMTTYASAFPSLVPATGTLWDMSIVTDSTLLFYLCHLPDLSYLYADSNRYSRGGFAYQGNAQYDITSGGIFEYGAFIKRDSYSLSLFTSGLTDSLIINTQHMVYSSPRTKIAFPATYNSEWTSSYSSDLNFDLSIVSFSYDHAPGYIRRYVTEEDSVVGWGKMRVKDISGVPSDSFNVLQVQTITRTTDSFFVNGAPFSTILLSQLNLTQGITDTAYQQNYYQPMEVTPLTQVTFSDASYTQPKSAIMQVKRMIGTTAITNSSEQSIHVYPNPVSGNNIFITTPAANTEWQYELVNVIGKAIKEGVISSKNNGNISKLTLPEATTPGAYYLVLHNNKGSKQAVRIDVVK